MQADNSGKSVVDTAMALLGIAHMAYIRPIKTPGKTGYAVCAADGTELAVFESEDEAYFTARQHNLQPVSIH